MKNLDDIQQIQSLRTTLLQIPEIFRASLTTKNCDSTQLLLSRDITGCTILRAALSE